METELARDFLVNRGNLKETRIVDAGTPEELRPGQVRLKIERFALTANNITYAKICPRPDVQRLIQLPCENSDTIRDPLFLQTR